MAIKKQWEYKIKGLRQAIVSADGVLMDGQLYFELCYRKGSFFESQLIRLNLNEREPEALFARPHVIRSMGIALEGRFYFNAFSGMMYCINGADGRVIWETSLGDGNPDWHICVDGGRLFAYNQVMYCLNRETGEILWRSGQNPEHANCHILIRGDRLFHGVSGGPVYCMEKSTGNMLWQYGEKQYVRSCAFLDKRTLMACTAGGSILLLDAEDGALLSEVNTGGALYMEPLIREGKVYLGNDNGDMVSWEFGADRGLVESFRYRAGQKVSTPAVLDGEALWFGTEDGYLYCLDAGSGKERTKKKKVSAAPRCLFLYREELVVLSDKGQMECFSK